ncbi:MAG: tRNA (N(6)-L-threonylcarbamoyladenosine(37)-C(2))-methylthiotransferase MtaB [Candidatus Symbiothrix sp.]|jgi:threonylcarbamoyladenosine tRNA methylthiotransferase MtaB|nr:tRNA (N(6)-L-threonylcarbamoyladenosine(37)-C(2))-methylthiotransferase MtaB [Candidatus Symbiothrix sp.]
MTDHPIVPHQKAVYYTLGCKLNFAETSTLGKYLADKGIQKAKAGETADVCIVNTCSVTELADKKCRQAIRRIKKQHPQAIMIVTGCYAQLKPDEVAQIEGVDLILGSNQKMEAVDYLLNKEFRNNRLAVAPIRNDSVFVPSCSQDDRTRHFLKVQDGCDYFCSYCTIPLARGRSRNGKIADLVQMAEQAGREGGKEIVLTGVNIGDFGKSTGETFFDLLKALDRVKNIERFRISSIEPNLLTDEILEFVALSKRFAPHFHIPLQSGSDAVLKLMRRRYDTSLFRTKIETIKSILPQAFIGIDVIVGTRGETPGYFAETLAFLESLPFSQLHVFSYSERPGTMALQIEPTVSPSEKQERSKQLLALSEQKLKAFYHLQTGTPHPVLFEHTKRNNKMYGFTDNYVKVEADYRPIWINRLIDVTLERFNEKNIVFTI